MRLGINHKVFSAGQTKYWQFSASGRVFIKTTLVIIKQVWTEVADRRRGRDGQIIVPSLQLHTSGCGL